MGGYDSEKDLYKKNWQAIAAELQLFGGDTVVNFFRGTGVLYEEILNDVGKRVGADFSKNTPLPEIEESILRTLFDKVTILDDLDLIMATLKSKGYLGLASIKESPLETIKQGLGAGSGTAATGIAALNIAKNFIKLNPLTTAITAPLTVKDVTAPAYRVTIPAVCIVAMLRRKQIDYFNTNNEF